MPNQIHTIQINSHQRRLLIAAVNAAQVLPHLLGPIVRRKTAADTEELNLLLDMLTDLPSHPADVIHAFCS